MKERAAWVSDKQKFEQYMTGVRNIDNIFVTSKEQTGYLTRQYSQDISMSLLNINQQAQSFMSDARSIIHPDVRHKMMQQGIAALQNIFEIFYTGTPKDKIVKSANIEEQTKQLSESIKAFKSLSNIDFQQQANQAVFEDLQRIKSDIETELNAHSEFSENEKSEIKDDLDRELAFAKSAIDYGYAKSLNQHFSEISAKEVEDSNLVMRGSIGSTIVGGLLIGLGFLAASSVAFAFLAPIAWMAGGTLLATGIVGLGVFSYIDHKIDKAFDALNNRLALSTNYPSDALIAIQENIQKIDTTIKNRQQASDADAAGGFRKVVQPLTKSTQTPKQSTNSPPTSIEGEHNQSMLKPPGKS